LHLPYKGYLAGKSMAILNIVKRRATSRYRVTEVLGCIQQLFLKEAENHLKENSQIDKS